MVQSAGRQRRCHDEVSLMVLNYIIMKLVAIVLFFDLARRYAAIPCIPLQAYGSSLWIKRIAQAHGSSSWLKRIAQAYVIPHIENWWATRQILDSGADGTICRLAETFNDELSLMVLHYIIMKLVAIELFFVLAQRYTAIPCIPLHAFHFMRFHFMRFHFKKWWTHRLFSCCLWVKCGICPLMEIG